MDQRQLASVLFAAIGVFVAVSRLPEIFSYVTILAQWNPANEDPASPFPQRLVAAATLGGLLSVVLVGSALVLLRDRLAERLFPGGSHPLNVRDVQAVAFSVLGCYFIVEGLSGLSRFVWARPIDWASVTQLVLGVALLLGARGLARLWLVARSAGT